MVFFMLGEKLLKVVKRYNYRGIPLDIVSDLYWFRFSSSALSDHPY
jgi:hypothetical protein